MPRAGRAGKPVPGQARTYERGSPSPGAWSLCTSACFVRRELGCVANWAAGAASELIARPAAHARPPRPGFVRASQALMMLTSRGGAVGAEQAGRSGGRFTRGTAAPAAGQGAPDRGRIHWTEPMPVHRHPFPCASAPFKSLLQHGASGRAPSLARARTMCVPPAPALLAEASLREELQIAPSAWNEMMLAELQK